MKTANKCFCCGRIVEPEKSTKGKSGPVCLACFWAAKFIYENGWQEFKDIPDVMADMCREIMQPGGYLWPDDLIDAMEKRPFDKPKVQQYAWWSPRHDRLGGTFQPQVPLEDLDKLWRIKE